MYKNVFVSETCVLQNKKPFYVGKNISLLFFFSESRLQLQFYLILQKDSKTDLKINISIYKLFFKALTNFSCTEAQRISGKKIFGLLDQIIETMFFSVYTLVNSEQFLFVFCHLSNSFRFRTILVFVEICNNYVKSKITIYVTPGVSQFSLFIHVSSSIQITVFETKNFL